VLEHQLEGLRNEGLRSLRLGECGSRGKKRKGRKSYD